MGSPTGLTLRLPAFLAAVAVVVAPLLALAPAATAVPLPPPNPSDSDIAASESDANSRAAEVGRLSGVISTTQAKIQQLNDAMELKAELAMKARYDVVLALNDLADAETQADEAAQAAKDASALIEAAQQQAAEFAAASFRQGSVIGSGMTALIDSESLDDLLARREMIVQVSGNQTSVLDALQTARTIKGNRDSEAKAAVQRADAARAAAVAAQAAAEQAEADATQAFAQGQDQLNALQQQLQQQQAQYQAALNRTAELKGQRAQHDAWVVAKRQEDQQLAEQQQVHRDEAQQLQAERELAQKLQADDAANRKVVIANEIKRQEKLRKERERIAALKKQAEADGQDPNQVDTSSVSDGSRGQQVVAAALKWLGTPYAWGGGNANGPTKGIRDYGVADRYGDYNKTGFDCSGLALYAWAQQGVYLPHYSGYQYNYGTRVGKADLQAGDLVFYAYNTANPATIHHVAIYMGNGQMIEAPQSGSVVKISPMRWSGYIGAARPGS